MVKVHILGGPGSGKTTLAQNISVKLHVPHYDLDQIGWKQGNRLAAYVDDAFALAAQPEWITEGVFLIWTDPLLYQADYIILLEVSWPLAAWRIIVRHISKSLRGTNPYRGVKTLFNFLKDVRGYYVHRVSLDKSTVESVRQYFAEHGERIEAPDTALLLSRLETYSFMMTFHAEFVRMYLEKYKEKVFVVKKKTDRERLIRLLLNRTES